RRIDELVRARIKSAGFEPAALAGDEEFIRRVYLDLAGAIPRVAEVREFLADERTDKRARLIDVLLDSPAHATHLANTWRNIMLPGGLNLDQINNVVGVQNWLRQRFVENVRYDNLVSELLVASDGGEAGPALYYTSLDLAPEKLAGSTARIFLGLQIECAQCHDHPFDNWKQKDFWGYAAFFARLRQPAMNNPSPRGRARLLDLDEGDVKLPNTEEIVLPRYPAGASPDDKELGTRREQLAIWMASRDNPFLSRAGVNRTWWHLFGRGLVEPVDDIGRQNAPSHPELLDELTAYFVTSGFDLRELYRTLVNTETYQRTSHWAADLSPPPELYVHMSVKTLTAEQLYDSVNRVLHRRTRSMLAGINVNSPLLDPQRQSFIAKVQSSGRNFLEYQAGVLQSLSLLNGSDLAEATDPERSPLLGSLQAPFFIDDDRLRTLFLATYARQPTEPELGVCRRQLAEYSESDRAKAFSDILWALLNSAEFALNH
ncbi:MAG TPA: DUF1549 and DUF1553 domain-containing protein, partial [Pirellulaceae bacterium]|nr:DUF1549 and DUF1553 domain-containing protein [Pirellulaceae bacterium]